MHTGGAQEAGALKVRAMAQPEEDEPSQSSSTSATSDRRAVTPPRAPPSNRTAALSRRPTDEVSGGVRASRTPPRHVRGDAGPQLDRLPPPLPSGRSTRRQGTVGETNDEDAAAEEVSGGVGASRTPPRQVRDTEDAGNAKAINVRRLALYTSNYYSEDEEDPADVRDYGSTLGSGFDESKSAVHTGGQQQHSETCTREIEISSGTIICCNHCTHRLKWCLLTLIASLSIALIHQFLRWLGRDFR